MPATYAHYSFGKEIAVLLGGELKKSVEAYPALFLAGLQGPDLLFFYRPLSHNAVNGTGYALHEESGKTFFDHAARLTANSRGEERAKRLAYAAGHICHYSLDVSCHGYIENKIRISGVSHYTIEKEFDKYMMRRDGLDPFKADIACGVKKDAGAAKTITPFFNGLSESGATIDEKQILGALGGFVFYNRAMQGKGAALRFMVTAALRLSGKYKSMRDMLYLREDDRRCGDSNLRLEKLAKSAKAPCLMRADCFMRMAEGGAAQDGLFDPTYGPCDGWQTIPVLTEDEEEKYEI